MPMAQLHVGRLWLRACAGQAGGGGVDGKSGWEAIGENGRERGEGEVREAESGGRRRGVRE